MPNPSHPHATIRSITKTVRIACDPRGKFLDRAHFVLARSFLAHGAVTSRVEGAIVGSTYALDLHSDGGV
jgi:hypothetical protein